MVSDRCLGSPTAKQREFLEADTRFVAYGGARGGGKSWAVRKKAILLALRYPGIRLLLLRRTLPELRENHILPLLEELRGIAQYSDSRKSFTFPGGSYLKFGYCDAQSDVQQYQGQEYDVIFLDEATHFTEYQFRVLAACLRGANSFPKRMYLTCNPGGVGHDWVKRLFVDRQFRGRERGEDYTFIPARVYDNEALLAKDPGYIEMLEALPDSVRRAWLEGDWDCFEGMFFPEFSREVHVLKPFLIPEDWRRYFTMDYGLDMLAGYWIGVDEAGCAYVYREVYESGLIISDAARAIRERTQENIYSYLAPPDLWNRRQDTGKSAAEIFLEEGICLAKAQNSRIQGWLDLKEWLKPYRDREGRMTARLRIFSSCRNLIRCLPALRFDENIPGDCARDPHELTHGPDAIRYFAAGRPLPFRREAAARERLPFPLQTQEEEGEENVLVW